MTCYIFVLLASEACQDRQGHHLLSDRIVRTIPAGELTAIRRRKRSSVMDTGRSAEQRMTCAMTYNEAMPGILDVRLHTRGVPMVAGRIIHLRSAQGLGKLRLKCM